MITLPLPQITAPALAGRPHHGFVMSKQVGGVLSYVALVGADEFPLPTSWGVFPDGRRLSHLVSHPDAPPLTLSPSVVAAEAAQNRRWTNFATIAGRNGVFYGAKTGERSWIAVLPDNNAWRVSIVSLYDTALGANAWRMVFERCSYGPPISGRPLHEYRWFSIRLINTSAGATNYFTAASAKIDMAAVNPLYTPVDISLHGRKLIVAGATIGVSGYAGTMSGALIPIRIPTGDEFAGWGINLATVSSGHVPAAQFDPVVDHVVEAEVVNHYSAQFVRTYPLRERQRRPMYEYMVAVMDGEDKLTGTLGVGGPLTVVDGDAPGSKHYMHTLTEQPITYAYSLTRKAHLAEDTSEGWLMYEIEAQVAVHYAADGVLYLGTTGAGTPPATPATTVTVTYEIEQTVRYGDEFWTATAITTDTLPASLFVNNSGSGPDEAAGVWRVAPPALPAAFKPYALFYACPEHNITGDETDPAVWNLNYYDYNDAYGIAHGSQDGGEFTRPMMHMLDRTGVEFGAWFPAHAEIPKGSYYKGRYISDWLPAHDVTWAFDQARDQILLRPRPATSSADGYIHAAFV